jgi:hypothetical protein
MTTRPNPGNLEYQNPELELVGEILALVSNGTPRRDAVAMLIGRGLERNEVETAHTYWVGQMPRFAWEDYTGNDVLMILEDVLREIPRGK